MATSTTATAARYSKNTQHKERKNVNANHTQMTEEFLDYARPLIQAELTPLYIAGLPHHIYLKK